jgi:GTP cyclohydrolase II
VFSYVDLNIRCKLEEEGRLVHLDKDGCKVDCANGCEPFISILGPIPLPRQMNGEKVLLEWYPFVRRVQLAAVQDAAARVRGGGPDALRELLQSSMSVNSLLALPGFGQASNPLVRVHSCCMTGDVFGSLRCECGPQLDTAFRRICEEGNGAVVYMNGHEGRGIGLWAKAVTYLLQDQGQDTYQANVSLGLPEDSRDFAEAAVVLRHFLKGSPVRLLSNNPLKREHLERYGQPVSALVQHVIGINEHNLRYMQSKKEKGHALGSI